MRTPDKQYQRRKRKIEKIKRLISRGYNDDEIAAKTEYSAESVAVVRTDLRDIDKLAFQSLENSTVYSDYLSKQSGILRALRNLQLKYAKSWGGPNSRNGAIVLAALTKQSDIYDKCVKMGQELGFIDKKSSSLEVEFSYKDLAEDDLKAEIKKEMKKISNLGQGPVIEMRPEMMKAIGDASFAASNVIEMPDKERRIKKAKIKAKIKINS